MFMLKSTDFFVSYSGEWKYLSDVFFVVSNGYTHYGVVHITKKWVHIYDGFHDTLTTEYKKAVELIRIKMGIQHQPHNCVTTCDHYLSHNSLEDNCYLVSREEKFSQMQGSVSCGEISCFVCLKLSDCKEVPCDIQSNCREVALNCLESMLWQFTIYHPFTNWTYVKHTRILNFVQVKSSIHDILLNLHTQL